jgi:hypothetical protein
MQYPVFFFAFLAFLSGNYHKENTPLHENIDCKEKIMKMAGNETNKGMAIPENLNKGFIIMADTNKAINYISTLEETLRNVLLEYDTITVKDEKQEKSRMQIKKNIDSIHNLNKDVHLVMIYNNSTKTVILQKQDQEFICILQGLHPNGQWRPIQYWRGSGCGNSYWKKIFAPSTTAIFAAHIPNQGNYETKLRFKILGINQFYYSNEFPGKIDVCEFEGETERFRYRFDTFINFCKDR